MKALVKVPGVRIVGVTRGAAAVTTRLRLRDGESNLLAGLLLFRVLYYITPQGWAWGEKRLAESLLPEDEADAATWSIALMELGALVCTARIAHV